jgi:hypothetical protein
MNNRNLFTIIGAILMIGPICLSILGAIMGFLLGCQGELLDPTCRFAGQSTARLIGTISFAGFFTVFTLLPGMIIFSIGHRLSKNGQVRPETVTVVEAGTEPELNSKVKKKVTQISTKLFMIGIVIMALGNFLVILPIPNIIKFPLILATLFSPFLLILGLVLFIVGYFMKE